MAASAITYAVCTCSQYCDGLCYDTAIGIGELPCSYFDSMECPVKIFIDTEGY